MSGAPLSRIRAFASGLWVVWSNARALCVTTARTTHLPGTCSPACGPLSKDLVPPSLRHATSKEQIPKRSVPGVSGQRCAARALTCESFTGTSKTPALSPEFLKLFFSDAAWKYNDGGCQLRKNLFSHIFFYKGMM